MERNGTEWERLGRSGSLDVGVGGKGMGWEGVQKNRMEWEGV